MGAHSHGPISGVIYVIVSEIAHDYGTDALWDVAATLEIDTSDAPDSDHYDYVRQAIIDHVANLAGELTSRPESLDAAITEIRDSTRTLGDAVGRALQKDAATVGAILGGVLAPATSAGMRHAAEREQALAHYRNLGLSETRIQTALILFRRTASTLDECLRREWDRYLREQG